MEFDNSSSDVASVTASTTEVSKRLNEVSHLIPKILQACGGAGASISIVHENEMIYERHFGYRDISTKTEPNSDTIYTLASLTKHFTASALGILVDQKKVNWDTPIHEILPGFKTLDDTVTKRATVTDLLCHDTGLSDVAEYWNQGDNKLLLSKKDTLKTYNNLKPVNPFRQKFGYSNIGFALAGEIIETLSRKSYGQFLEDNLFTPLGMTRSSVNPPSQTESNAAKFHTAISDRSPYLVPGFPVADGTFFTSVIGVRSTIRDLTIAYKSLLQQNKENPSSKTSSEEPNPQTSPFKEVSQIWSSHMPLTSENSSPAQEQSSGLGWFRTQLPGCLSHGTLTELLLPSVPIAGEGSKSRLVLHHGGCLPGALNHVYILPETNTIILVLTNTLALGDPSDLIGQLLLETIFNHEDGIKRDWLSLAEQSATGMIGLASQVLGQLEDHRVPNTKPRPYSDYCGRYYNSIGTFYIEIQRSQDQDGLIMSFQGRDTYQLRHYHHDIFEWSLPYDEAARRAMMYAEDYEFYLITFQSNGDGKLGSLRWKCNGDLSEDFFKEVYGTSA